MRSDSRRLFMALAPEVEKDVECDYCRKPIDSEEVVNYGEGTERVSLHSGHSGTSPCVRDAKQWVRVLQSEGIGPDIDD